MVKVRLIRLLRSRSMTLNYFSSFLLRFNQGRQYGLPILQAKFLIFLSVQHLNLLIITSSPRIQLSGARVFHIPRPSQDHNFISDPISLSVKSFSA